MAALLLSVGCGRSGALEDIPDCPPGQVRDVDLNCVTICPVGTVQIGNHCELIGNRDFAALPDLAGLPIVDLAIRYPPDLFGVDLFGVDLNVKCPVGTIGCGGVCVNPDTDPKNCGSCANVCSNSAPCRAGHCALCPAIFTWCYGVCVDLQSDPANCNACGFACSNAGQGFVATQCVMGECCNEDQSQCTRISCGDTLCNRTCANLDIDPANCGGCGHVCQSNMCTSGICGQPCSTPMVACEGKCVDLTSDNGDCGLCGIACTSGSVCVNGACVCPAGTKPCSGICTDESTDVNNCGGCGVRCPSAGQCSNGVCQ